MSLSIEMVITPNQEEGTPAENSSQLQQQTTLETNSTAENQSVQTNSSSETTPILTHPAPLPNELVMTCSDGNLKRPPPRCMIKIYKVPVGAVVSWHALLTPNHEEIAKYQLYTYQESSLPPSTSLWKKLGDIDPLPLPMVCTLTQFLAGCTYHFAIRAVDIHGRIGPFSESLSMYMEEDKIADEMKVKREEEKRKQESIKVKEEPVEMAEAEENGSETAQVSEVQDMLAVAVKDEEELDSMEVKDGERAAGGTVKEQEKAIVKDQDVVKEQDKGKVQVKDQDKEMVKEEKEGNLCSC
ncbi:hypothetical protein J437_LFUL008284 [Ladona fulva]|uniref:Fibronectin type-III domain-containing protein n=1 Tax=Ladona fulva TaxID=123851 RepID=A0A8K0P0Z7_LADFU|nr:hypothetical protein J437_LFUL008284 [Ladona fulva]